MRTIKILYNYSDLTVSHTEHVHDFLIYTAHSEIVLTEGVTSIEAEEALASLLFQASSIIIINWQNT